MWYKTGTVTATKNQPNLTGSGTKFISNVRVGEAIALDDGLHEITNIASDTAMSISPAYTGTTGAGKSYYIIPIQGYVKKLADKAALLLEGFENPIQQDDPRLSDAREWTAATVSKAEAEGGVATARRAWSALRVREAIVAWFNGVSGTIGRTILGRNTATQVRGDLGLGTAATKDVGTGSGNVMEVGAFGLGGARESYTANALAPSKDGFIKLSGDHGGVIPASGYSYNGFSIKDGGGGTVLLTPTTAGGAATVKSMGYRFVTYSYTNAILESVVIYTTGNTTVDSNGFIKNASPILKLHSDRIESNNEAPIFERIDTGHYQLTGTNGLRLDDGWYIETPHDRNKNPYFNVEWEQSSEPETDAGILEEPADVTLSIRCYERVWNPQTGTYDNGDPVDILDGRWIDLRMNEVRLLEGTNK